MGYPGTSSTVSITRGQNMDSTTTMAGNLCEDPELRFTSSGKPVLNLRLARNRPPHPDGTPRPADFITVVCWEDLAENLAELPKGCRVIVFGELRNRSYENTEGRTIWVTELHARDAGPSGKWNSVSSDFAPRGKRQNQPAPSEGELELPPEFA